MEHPVSGPRRRNEAFYGSFSCCFEEWHHFDSVPTSRGSLRSSRTSVSGYTLPPLPVSMQWRRPGCTTPTWRSSRGPERPREWKWHLSTRHQVRNDTHSQITVITPTKSSTSRHVISAYSVYTGYYGNWQRAQERCAPLYCITD